MSFDLLYFGRVSVTGNTETPVVFSYGHPTDDMATILTSGYFNNAPLVIGDFLLIDSADQKGLSARVDTETPTTIAPLDNGIIPTFQQIYNNNSALIALDPAVGLFRISGDTGITNSFLSVRSTDLDKELLFVQAPIQGLTVASQGRIVGIGNSSFAKVLNMTDDVLLGYLSEQEQHLNPNGVNRMVDLPQGASSLMYRIAHTGTANYLTIRDADFQPVAYVRPNENILLYWSFDHWILYNEQNIKQTFNENNKQTLTEDLVLDIQAVSLQLLAPSGTDRSVNLPLMDPAHNFMTFFIKNTGTTYNLTIKDTAGNPIIVLAPSISISVHYDDTNWILL